MSREYRIVEQLGFEDVVGGRLRKYGIAACRSKAEPDNWAALRRGSVVHVKAEGNHVNFDAIGENCEGDILNAVVSEFGVTILDEDDCRFWGYATEEEMVAGIRAARDISSLELPVRADGLTSLDQLPPLGLAEVERQKARIAAAFPMLRPDQFEDEHKVRAFMMILLPEFEEPEFEFKNLVPCHCGGGCLGYLVAEDGTPVANGRSAGEAKCSVSALKAAVVR